MMLSDVTVKYVHVSKNVGKYFIVSSKKKKQNHECTKRKQKDKKDNKPVCLEEEISRFRHHQVLKLYFFPIIFYCFPISKCCFWVIKDATYSCECSHFVYCFCPRFPVHFPHLLCFTIPSHFFPPRHPLGLLFVIFPISFLLPCSLYFPTSLMSRKRKISILFGHLLAPWNSTRKNLLTNLKRKANRDRRQGGYGDSFLSSRPLT